MNFQSLISGAAWTLCRLLPLKNNKVVISHFYGRGFATVPRPLRWPCMRPIPLWKLTGCLPT